MQALAEFIMRGRVQAIGVAVVGILLPFFLWFGVAAVGLVVLRKGGTEAVVVLGWGLLATFAVLLLQGDIGPMAALIATAAAAFILRWSSAWPLALIALVAVGFGTALILNLFSSEYLTQLVALLNQLLDKLRAEVPSPQVQALGQLTTAQISGWLGFWAAFSGFLAVLLARYWQASLYNPGGFRDEFHRLRLPPQLALLLLAVGLLLALLGPDYRVWIALIVLPFAIAGIALVHGIAGLKHWGRGPVVVLYLAWFFLLGLMTATLFLLALADSWLDFRGRLRARVQ